MTGLDEQQFRLLIVGAIALVVVLFGVVADIIWLSTLARRHQNLVINTRKILAVKLPLADLAKYGFLLFTSFCIGLVLIYFSSRFFSGGDEELRGIVIQSITLHMAIILLAGMYLKQKSETMEAFFGIHAKSVVIDLFKGLFFLLVSMPVILAFSMIWRGILYMLGQPLDIQDIMQQLTNEGYPVYVRIYLALLAVVLAPVAEEILFRGVIFRWVAKRGGIWAGMLISSLLFALIHVHIPSFGPIFALAMALSFFYAASGSLLVPITMHALFNLFGYTVYYIAGQ